VDFAVTQAPGALPVTLRDVTGADVAVFLEQQADAEAARMAAFPVRDRTTHFAHWERILSDPLVRKQAIVCGDRVAGNVVSYTRGSDRLVGYWLGREFWGQGVATRALAAFLALEPVRPLYARVAKHNVASRRVLEKCGFEVEGEDRTASGPSEPLVEEWIFRCDTGPRRSP
jgi:RimJ/RimL family protein N-acetyltransferase